MKFLSAFVGLLFIASSCRTIPGYLSGYDKLPDEYKARVLPCRTDMERLTNDGNVYQVSVEQVDSFIGNHDKVLVYDWDCYCSSEGCVSPVLAEEYCKRRGITFCLIWSLYDPDAFLAVKQLSSPSFSIDTRPYKTDVKSRYVKRFYEELTDCSYTQRGYGRFLYFEEGVFVGALWRLPVTSKQSVGEGASVHRNVLGL